MMSISTLWLVPLLILNTFVVLESTHSWSIERQLFPAYKIPEDGLSPRRAVVRRKIVLYHNFFRTKVRPPASNMLFMSWHPGAARSAQNYAEKCIFLHHNDPRENAVPQLGSCGQNLFVAAQKTPWFFALKTWFLEFQNFTYGHPIRKLKDVGHYTQMVWATSHKIGCGVTLCQGGPWGRFYNYVCHYCPGGNIEGITQFPYKVGVPCNDCPNECISGSLCTNACNRKDVFSNCGMLYKFTNVCEQGVCNATCACGNRKLYKNYPW